MANTALELLKSGISFLSAIPIHGDVEILRRNLWVFPYIGFFIGLLISIPAFFDIRFLCIVFYILIEGINHMDGLADFGDAFFAPKTKKVQAIKDVAIGAGGVTFVVVYLIILYSCFLNASFFEIAASQAIAKFCMLSLLTFSKPAWHGMAAYMMELTRKRDVFLATPILAFIFFFEKATIFALLTSLLLTILIRSYAYKNFNGVSGDVAGATNCIAFATSLAVLTL